MYGLDIDKSLLITPELSWVIFSVDLHVFALSSRHFGNECVALSFFKWWKSPEGHNLDCLVNLHVPSMQN